MPSLAGSSRHEVLLSQDDSSRNRSNQERERHRTHRALEVTSIIFLLVAAPVLFCALTWLVATVYRLCVPEPVDAAHNLAQPLAARTDPVDVAAPVEVREISANQQRRNDPNSGRYAYARGFSTGLPSVWIDELWRRRN